MIKEVIAFASGYRLKNIKTMEGRQGIAWSATLYRNGAKIGQVIDDASGGQVRIDLPKADLETLAEVAKQKTPCDYEPEAIFLEQLVNYTQAIASMKRKNVKSIIKLDSKTLDEYGVPTMYSQFKIPNTVANVARVRKSQPTARLLNDEIALW